MAREGTRPHVLVGDLNVFEGTATVCSQVPTNNVLSWLRDAGYRDVWRDVHGDADGATGMLNRPRCGVPEGAPWKRIDYAWVRGYHAVGMTRFGLVTPGDGAPSDHAGILAAIADDAPPPSPTANLRELVLRTLTAATAGLWRLEPDPTAAGGQRVHHPDAAAAKLTAPLAYPLAIDQIVLSADRYRTTAPGALVEDTTILPLQP